MGAHQDLVFEQTSGKVCYRRIASESLPLWAGEVAGTFVLLPDMMRWAQFALWTFVEALIFIATPTSMEPAQQVFHVNEEEEGREGIPLDGPPFYGDGQHKKV
eukprot:1149157-Pelagomonas_calceolata.AAC.1